MNVSEAFLLKSKHSANPLLLATSVCGLLVFREPVAQSADQDR
jgi:hypothetical protein